jgi:alpha-N-arabinofuranosidase
VYSKKTNTVYINVVNRHKDKAITAEIINTAGTFAGKAQTSLLNAASLDEPFAFDKQDQYKPVTKELEVNGNRISCSFPPHSFTQIKVKVL